MSFLVRIPELGEDLVSGKLAQHRYLRTMSSSVRLCIHRHQLLEESGRVIRSSSEISSLLVILPRV